MTGVYRLIGAVPSPYSVKMRALLRYRRIPFIWERRTEQHAEEIKHIKPPTMPYLVDPDGSITNDSTLLIYALERAYAQRSVLTGHAGRDFISHLVEDFADEWGTRVMAFYRWNHVSDQLFCGRWAAGEHYSGRPLAERQAAAAAFQKRQLGRLMLLGAAPENRATMEMSYREVLSSLKQMLERTEYLFGSRPSLADFGWFGQLYQMSIDPTASAAMRCDAPDVLTWLLRLDDASGVEGEWQNLDEDIQPGAASLVRLAVITHLPLLTANAAAAKAGRETCSIEVNGMPFVQMTNKYHLKCLSWLRDEYRLLEGAARRWVDRQLDAAGGDAFFRGN